ncbi:NAC domain-containing protein 83-like [Phoenix dactylifera]|uniref:NAC domain-containing protein 83-like n=1 Tax=Phoenix dactylifera TaxID=42345 RepID=A0A8B8IZ91_PHODC|nr:NAC domain-containing protein 83-like [Phoenix dactylifera]
MEEDEGIGNVAPSHHFRPFPKELVEFYLRPRLLNQPLPCQAIKELNIYDFHPRDILGNTPAGKHLYFFTLRKMKYPNGTRPARGTNGGYWKASEKDQIIRDKDAKEIGCKKFLVFHEGHQGNGTRTRWLMQEYTVKEFWFSTDQNKDELGALALCEIYLKPTRNQSRDGELQVDEQEVEEEGSPSHSSDNIFADRRVGPRPPPWNNGKDAPVASTSGCPSAFGPVHPCHPWATLISAAATLCQFPNPASGPGVLMLWGVIVAIIRSGYYLLITKHHGAFSFSNATPPVFIFKCAKAPGHFRSQTRTQTETRRQAHLIFLTIPNKNYFLKIILESK